jgi:hypothetical protein
MHGLLVPAIPDIPMTQIPIDDSLVGICCHASSSRWTVLIVPGTFTMKIPDLLRDSDIAISDFPNGKSHDTCPPFSDGLDLFRIFHP